MYCKKENAENVEKQRCIKPLNTS